MLHVLSLSLLLAMLEQLKHNIQVAFTSHPSRRARIGGGHRDPPAERTRPVFRPHVRRPAHLLSPSPPLARPSHVRKVYFNSRRNKYNVAQRAGRSKSGTQRNICAGRSFVTGAAHARTCLLKLHRDWDMLLQLFGLVSLQSGFRVNCCLLKSCIAVLVYFTSIQQYTLSLPASYSLLE